MQRRGVQAVPLWKRPRIIIGGLIIIIMAVIIGILVSLLSNLFLQPNATPAKQEQGQGQSQGQGYWHTSGSQLLDKQNHPVRIAGINWFGFETSTYVVGGLNKRSYKSMLEQIKSLKYNTIRLPYSNQFFDPGNNPLGINYTLNPDLEGLSGLALMDKIVNYAANIGLHIILDQHRPDSNAQSALWYSPAYPESRWISDWKMLANHYKGNSQILGADLHDEPYTPSCWGCSDPKRDWRVASQDAGNEILQIVPDWLIFIEGVECYGAGGTTNTTDCYWRGGNLKGVSTAPVVLNVPHRLVYSIHDYPNSVNAEPWFNNANYPNNLPPLWDSYWGYIQKKGIAPVFVGEFGSKLETTSDRQWFSQLIQYLGTGSGGINWAFWSWNPTSQDTGGILENDWQTVDQTKQRPLDPILFPLNLSSATATPKQTQQHAKPSPTATSSSATSGQFQLLARTENIDTTTTVKETKLWFRLSNTGQSSINLSDITIRYWYTNGSGAIRELNCDYAALKCSNISSSVVTVQPPRTKANSYFKISFAAGASDLTPGADTGEIKLRFNNTDFSNYDESQDYSYPGPTTTYTLMTRITVYYKGTLVWGTEPA